MSLKAISEKLSEQNKLIVDMSDNNQKNSDRLNSSFDNMNDSLSSIAQFLTKEESEEETEKSRNRLKDKDKDDSQSKGKGLFGGMLGSKDKKSGKGLLGGIFSKALGFILKSLPLIGLAALFFGDVVTALLTAAIGDYDKASILKNIIAGGLIGSIFGFRTALLGAIFGFLFSKETWDGLIEKWNDLGESFTNWDWNDILGSIKNIGSALASFAAELGPIAGAIVAAAALIAPVAAARGAASLFKRMIFGKKGVAAKTAGATVATAATTSATAAKTSPKAAQRLVNAEAAKKLTDKQKEALSKQNLKVNKAGDIVDSKNKFISTEKQTQALKNVGVDTTKSVAKSAGKKAVLGAAAKAIPGLGILAGIGFGINSLKNGDPVAAGLHVASGIAGLVPGVGTAASLSLTGAAVARESGLLGGGGDSSDINVEVNGKSEVLSDATRERDELISKTSSNVIMDNSTTNNVSGGGGGNIDMSGPITWYDSHDPYAGHA